ncbi:MAG: hypothetical protein KF678_08065 [Phycisphaeraceae bacterium]|nr:hypothetical protein [Phycisphaeraceae bacterium]
MRAWLLVVVAAMAGGGCVSGGSREPDGPARAMARLKAPVRAAGEGYIAALEALTRELASVTDTAGARAALPRVEGLLGDMGGHWRTLEDAGASARAEARYAFWRRLNAADAGFESQVNRINGTPGVGPALGPLLDKVPRWR